MSEDIVERLKELIVNLPRPGAVLPEGEIISTLRDAIAEIEFLRTHAGAVTRGESFDDIAKRVGRQPKDEAAIAKTYPR